MSFNTQADNFFGTEILTSSNEQIVIEANQISNPVLQRLMEEVKNDQANNIFAYDRAHNRHNRS